MRPPPNLITGVSAVLPGNLKKQDKQSLRARGRIRKRSGEMNKVEAAFAEELQRRKAAGWVLWFAFEAVKLRLADNTFYTPDFAVMFAEENRLWLIDTKGTTKKDGAYKPWCEEDSRIKMKLTAELFPITVAVAYRLPLKEGGEWRIEEV